MVLASVLTRGWLPLCLASCTCQLLLSAFSRSCVEFEARSFSQIWVLLTTANSPAAVIPRSHLSAVVYFLWKLSYHDNCLILYWFFEATETYILLQYLLKNARNQVLSSAHSSNMSQKHTFSHGLIKGDLFFQFWLPNVTVVTFLHWIHGENQNNQRRFCCIVLIAAGFTGS